MLGVGEVDAGITDAVVDDELADAGEDDDELAVVDVVGAADLEPPPHPVSPTMTTAINNDQPRPERTPRTPSADRENVVRAIWDHPGGQTHVLCATRVWSNAPETPPTERQYPTRCGYTSRVNRGRYTLRYAGMGSFQGERPVTNSPIGRIGSHQPVPRPARNGQAVRNVVCRAVIPGHRGHRRPSEVVVQHLAKPVVARQGGVQ